MKRTLATAFMALAIVFAGTAVTVFGQKGNNDRDTACDRAGRERAVKEIDHATGKASEKEMKDARDREAKACDGRGRN